MTELRRPNITIINAHVALDAIVNRFERQTDESNPILDVFNVLPPAHRGLILAGEATHVVVDLGLSTQRSKSTTIMPDGHKRLADKVELERRLAPSDSSHLFNVKVRATIRSS